MQNKGLVNISHFADRGLNITKDTLIIDSLFFTAQVSIDATWINDRDQFLGQMMVGKRIQISKMIAWRMRFFMVKTEFQVIKVQTTDTIYRTRREPKKNLIAAHMRLVSTKQPNSEVSFNNSQNKATKREFFTRSQSRFSFWTWVTWYNTMAKGRIKSSLYI